MMSLRTSPLYWCGDRRECLWYNPFPLQRPDFAPVTKEKTDCHVAALLAMTVVDGTSVLNDAIAPKREARAAGAVSVDCVAG